MCLFGRADRLGQVCSPYVVSDIGLVPMFVG